MQRRLVICLTGALPLVTAVELIAQTRRVARVGVLVMANWERSVAEFKAALRELGYIEGQNLVVEFRAAEGNPEKLNEHAAELVRMKVDVIAAFLTPAVHAARAATRTLPIVMAGAGDPVGTGLIASLARPGGNITGIAALGPDLAGKSLELMRELHPGIQRVAVLANATDPFTKPMLEQLGQAAKVMSLDIQPTMVKGPDEYAGAFDAWAKQRVDAVFVQPSLPMPRAIELALHYRLPSFSFVRTFVPAGGLLAYAANNSAMNRRSAWYVDKILKGANPADLPVEQPTSFSLMINGKTAKALGLKIPQSLLLRADEVIE